MQSTCEMWAAFLYRYPESAHKGGKTHQGHGFPCHHTFQHATKHFNRGEYRVKQSKTYKARSEMGADGSFVLRKINIFVLRN